MPRASVFVCFFLFISAITACQKHKTESPVPPESRQMIVVITPSFNEPDARLFRFERAGGSSNWQMIGDAIPAIVGKNGLGWGIGLHNLQNREEPVKQEGDGRSPAGVFKLGEAFGYALADSMVELKIPYIHVRELVECVDDQDSRFYNQIVERDEVDSVDWQSSERMWRGKIWYEQGVVVEHNRNPVTKGAGSCIFLHNWAGEDDSTSGCTAMDPVDMMEIIYWLDAALYPLLVQLPEPVYRRFKNSWELPAIKK
ncbi:MAG: hypothetical protein EH225_05785 [Calditrichaeota bacterium]|nr:L,D-transpeptidase family protein [Calditrichota bacterium]RQW04552.1 MAG: hypothetical protein EH225_05785 [Calditrichota bacterium]